MSPLFELKVELRTFNSQKNTPNAIFNTVYQCSRPRELILYCPMFYSNVAKINSTRHSLRVSVAKKYQNVASEPGSLRVIHYKL